LPERRPKFAMRTKIWIEDNTGEVVFGAGRFRILSAVAEFGSLSAAAKALGMSYRAVWGKIKATEDRLGQDLLRKQSGGIKGGGSELTPFAGKLLRGYSQLENMTRAKADRFFLDFFGGTLSAKKDPQKRS